MTLVEFLTARLDDDEERATFVQRQTEGSNRAPFEDWRLSWHDEYDLLCIEPSRALREVEAKRAIVAGVVKVLGDDDRQTVTSVLGTFVAVYADHPDFDPAWRL